MLFWILFTFLLEFDLGNLERLVVIFNLKLLIIMFLCMRILYVSPIWLYINLKSIYVLHNRNMCFLNYWCEYYCTVLQHNKVPSWQCEGTALKWFILSFLWRLDHMVKERLFASVILPGLWSCNTSILSGFCCLNLLLN